MSTPSETPAQAEAEAETARAGLVNTLNQLRENLKPANVVDEVMTSAKVNVSALSDQVWDTAKNNPMPAMLIGAGLVMLFGFGSRYGLSSTTPRSAPRPQPKTDASHEHELQPEFRAHIARAPVRQTSTRVQPTLGARTSSSVGSLTGRASSLLDDASQRVSGAVSRGADSVSNAFASSKRNSSMRSHRPIGKSLNHLIEEQPLILAAVGVAIGAALGAALPQTDTENDLMGETSGSLRNAAQGMVQDQLAQVKAAASHAVDDIKQTVADHGVTAENLSGLAHDVGDKARAATYEAGRAVNPQS